MNRLAVFVLISASEKAVPFVCKYVLFRKLLPLKHLIAISFPQNPHRLFVIFPCFREKYRGAITVRHVFRHFQMVLYPGFRQHFVIGRSFGRKHFRSSVINPRLRKTRKICPVTALHPPGNRRITVGQQRLYRFHILCRKHDILAVQGLHLLPLFLRRRYTTRRNQY